MRGHSGVSVPTVSAGLVAVLAVWIVEAGSVPGERQALIWIHDAGGTTTERVAQVLSDATELVPLGVVAAGVVAVLLTLLRGRDAARLVAGIAVVWAVNPLLKEIVGRSRPDMWPLPESISQYGFPSGHAANTAALVGIVLMILRGRRVLVIGTAVGAVVLVVAGLAQLVLGRHYPSDLLAGWLLALAWVSFLRNVTKGGPE